MGNLVSEIVLFTQQAIQHLLIWVGIAFLPMLGTLQGYPASAIATYSDTYVDVTTTYSSTRDPIETIREIGDPEQVYVTLHISLSNTSTTRSIRLNDVTLLDSNNTIMQPRRPNGGDVLITMDVFYPVSDTNLEKALPKNIPPLSTAKGVLEYALPTGSEVTTVILSTRSGDSIRIPITTP